MNKDAEKIKKEIEEIDKAIYELDSGVKIVGEVDQSGAIILSDVSERKSWQEAAEHRKKKDELLANRDELEKLLKQLLCY